MMATNPFLDPKREIAQGKTDEDILAEHEKKLAEQAKDAASYRPEAAPAGGGAGAGAEGAPASDDDSIDRWVDDALKKVVNPVMGKVGDYSGTGFGRQKKKKWREKLMKSILYGEKEDYETGADLDFVGKHGPMDI